jgi:sporulation protein YlmC with PRC-barrel domain
MKTRVAVLLAATGVWLAVAGIALADEPKPGVRVGVGPGGVHVDVGAPGHETHAAAMKVSDMIGIQVRNQKAESLGKIEDLVMDPASGKIRYAVLSFGGFLGLGDKLFAVPWSELKLVPGGKTSEGTVEGDYYVLNVHQEALQNAPGFDKEHWPNFANPGWSAEVDRYYTAQRQGEGTRTR